VRAFSLLSKCAYGDRFDVLARREAKDRGLDHAVPRTPENTTPTSFRAWCTEVLRPSM
jgi:hypothetical protein